MVFFFIPGQVGATEVTYTVVFEALGFSAAAGFSFSFLRRLRNVAAAGIGLLLLWGLTGRFLPSARRE